MTNPTHAPTELRQARWLLQGAASWELAIAIAQAVSRLSLDGEYSSPSALAHRAEPPAQPNDVQIPPSEADKAQAAQPEIRFPAGMEANRASHAPAPRP